MFDKWEIDGLRGVGRVELSFDADKRARVMFGPNGVGKTKCLEAMFEALVLTNKDFYDVASISGWSKNWEMMKEVRCDQRDIFSSKGSSYAAAVVRAIPNETMHQLPVIFLGAQLRSSIGDHKKNVSLIGTFEDRRKSYFDQLLMAISKKKLRDIGMSQSVEAWFVSRAQSVNPYQKESDNRKTEIDVVMRVLNSIDLRINPSKLEIDGSGSVYLEIDGHLRELHELSSGFASLVKIAQAIVSGYANFTNRDDLQRVRGIVFIDEIESHLHPEWQSKIIPVLNKSLPNTTFFIATHSPIVLSQLEQGEAYLLNREDDGVVRTTEIDSPNKRGFVDVLESGFGVDLNSLKYESMLRDDQAVAKSRLRDLLKTKGS